MTFESLTTPPQFKITQQQFEVLAQVNRELRLEKTATGELIIMPPTGGNTGRKNLEIEGQLWLWNRQTRLGIVFNSSTGFYLPTTSQTVNLDLYELRQQRIDFNSVGFQIISRIGHLIFNQTSALSDVQQETLIKTLANLDYNRECQLWQNSVVIDDGNGNKKIIAQMAAMNKAFKVAAKTIQESTGITLM